MPLVYSKRLGYVQLFVSCYVSDTEARFKAELYFAPPGTLLPTSATEIPPRYTEGFTDPDGAHLVGTYRWEMPTEEAYYRRRGSLYWSSMREHIRTFFYMREPQFYALRTAYRMRWSEPEPYAWLEFEDAEGYYHHNALDLTMAEQLELCSDREVEREYMGQRMLAPPRTDFIYYETGIDHALG